MGGKFKCVSKIEKKKVYRKYEKDKGKYSVLYIIYITKESRSGSCRIKQICIYIYAPLV